ncbi:ATP-binding protein [Marinobacterium sp. xm-a-152]|uniref:ATP-binding protein n=1 Tax=Marinobacterium sp. xm-a-152 TaxID=2497733 RepID=UPI00156949F3|nr:ATP-binding protein [Marinobacterium sp. xm-a-152]NRP16763.1 C4-dicarboxylate transport sensor protein DctB [Marinobacterium sp. xm-a-152]
MIRNSIKTKTILGVAAIEAVLLITLIVMMLGFIRDTNFNEMDKRANATAKLFAITVKDAVLAYDLASLNAFVDEVMKSDDILYARVLDQQGRTLTQSDTISPGDIDLEASEVDDGIFDAKAVIEVDGDQYGMVEVGFSIHPILNTIEEAKRWSYAIAALEMVLVAIFSFVLGRYLINKLSLLRDAAETISQGELKTQIEVKGNDEIDVVATAFNRMSSTLKATREQEKTLEQQLRNLNEELENKVEQRTLALSEKNHLLELANHEIKAAQAKLIAAEKQASLGILASGIAHEVNNPLSIVRSNIDTLRDYIEQCVSAIEQIKKESMNPEQLNPILDKADFDYLSSDYPSLIDESEAAILRVTLIISQLRNLELNREESELELVNLRSLVEQGAEQAVQQLPDRAAGNCKILIQLPDSLFVRAKARLAIDAISGVVTNALQAVPPEQEALVNIQCEREGSELKLTIEDNGMGIETQDINNIFDPFFTTREIGAGTGLGLFKVQTLMKSMDGDIELVRAKPSALFQLRFRLD